MGYMDAMRRSYVTAIALHVSNSHSQYNEIRIVIAVVKMPQIQQERSSSVMQRFAWFWIFIFILIPKLGQADQDTNWMHRINVGGYGGADLATSAGPGANFESVSASHKLGLSVGGSVGIRLHERFATQLELAFSTKGPRSTRDGMDSATYHRNYLEVPILARAIFPLDGDAEYYATVGPVMGFLLSADADLVDGSNVDLFDRTEPIDIGLMLGAGAAVPVGQRGAVTFDIRYNLGLINIDKTAGPVDDDVMNRTVYFLVGYQTDLGFLSGAAPAASKSSLPVAEPPANDNEPTSPDAVPTSGEPEAGTESDPEESLLPE
jgi:hypothetical protein